MNINWTEKERVAIRNLSKIHELMDKGIVRLALRFYQACDVRIQNGERIQWLDSNGNPVPEKIGGCMGD